MSTCRPTTFQTQLSAIMEVLTKAAVAEISRLVDDRYAVLHLEVSRHQNENEMLKGKLLSVESELKSALLSRRDKDIENYVEKVGGPSDWRANETPDEVPAFSTDAIMKPFTENSSADIETAKSLGIKEERTDEDLWNGDPCGDGLQIPGNILYRDVLEEFPIENQHFEDEHHPRLSCGKEPREHCGEPRLPAEAAESNSTLRHNGEKNIFVVKMEKEEDHSELALDACQHNTGKRNPPDIGFAMDERDSQLWASIVQENPNMDADFPPFCDVADHYSQTFSDCLEAPACSASKEPSRQSLSTPRSPCKTVRNHVYHKEHTSQFMSSAQCMAQRSQRNDHISLSSQPMLQKPTASHSGTSFLTSDQLSLSHPPKSHHYTAARREKFNSFQRGKTFNRSPFLKIHQHVAPGHGSLSCTVCGKTFASIAHLVQHNRVHTGERPFGCTTCGKRFSQKGSLKAHQRIHSGERPFCCAQCGKTFTLKHHLKRHRLIHRDS